MAAVVQRSRNPVWPLDTIKCNPTADQGWGFPPWDSGLWGSSRPGSGLILWGKAGPASWEDGVLRLVCQVEVSDRSQPPAFPSEPSCLERVLLSLSWPKGTDQ